MLKGFFLTISALSLGWCHDLFGKNLKITWNSVMHPVVVKSLEKKHLPKTQKSLGGPTQTMVWRKDTFLMASWSLHNDIRKTTSPTTGSHAAMVLFKCLANVYNLKKISDSSSVVAHVREASPLQRELEQYLRVQARHGCAHVARRFAHFEWMAHEYFTSPPRALMVSSI